MYDTEIVCLCIYNNNFELELSNRWMLVTGTAITYTKITKINHLTVCAEMFAGLNFCGFHVLPGHPRKLNPRIFVVLGTT